MTTPVHIKKDGAPTEAELQELLSLIGEFRSNKYYEGISGDEFFGIKQKDGTVNWCSVMGQAQMEFGVSIFHGNKSLEAFEDLLGDPHSPDCFFFRDLDGVFFNLGSKKELAAEQLEILSELNFKTYGRGNGWPQLSTYVPGHAISAHLSRKNVRALIQLLTHLPEIIADYKAKKMKWVDTIEEERLPVLSIQKGNRVWESLPYDSFLFDDDDDFEEVCIDEFSAAKLPSLKPVGNSLFIGAPLLYMPIGETNPPYLPEALAIMDAQSGMVLHFELLPQSEDSTLLRAQEIAKFLISEGVKPAELLFDDDLLCDCFDTIYDGSGTEVTILVAPDFYTEMLEEMAAMAGAL